MTQTARNPNKQLDEAVAQHILEWQYKNGVWVDPATEKEVQLQPFSKDLNAAWTLTDKICERGFRLQLEGSKL
jgi:hypothetical protein